ncbi:MAG TPA: succinate dehydrogenase cytochrome b subunit [Myxococcota bacterium]|nr:succinate dehydrogenase cytochrome b subunit [Myxococcota bacterium]
MQNSSPILSTIGKKILVAITGLFMLLFVIMHLIGNLEVYQGPAATNAYAALLRQFPKVLWGFRILLIVAVVVHIWVTISLTKRNRDARPIAYNRKRSRKATLTSRTMLLTGLTVLVFVCYHLAQFTLSITNPEYDRLFDLEGRHHVYNMVVLGFSNLWVSLFYIIAMAMLAFHLSHGISSAARTLGVAEPKLFGLIHRSGLLFSWLIAVLFISIPIAVLLGFLPLDTMRS